MEKSMSNAEFEKMLVEQLSTELDKSQLSSLSKSVARLGNNAYIIDWRWVGTPGFWDIVNVNFQVPVKEFKPENFFGDNGFAELRIIRKGIPVPRFFDIQATIRNSRRQF